MGLRHGIAAIGLAVLLGAAAAARPLPADERGAQALAFQQRQVEAAEAARIAAEKSATAAELSARVAKGQVAWTRLGVTIALLALVGPYGVVLWTRHLTRRGARASAESAFDTCATACGAARDANLGKGQRPDGDVWVELTELSAARNVVDVQLRAGTAGHQHLLALSQILQLNYATADALQMRLSTAKPLNLSTSDKVLGSVEARAQSARGHLPRL